MTDFSKNQKYERNISMALEIPDYIVHLTTSQMPSRTSAPMRLPGTGVLLHDGCRNVIVSAAAKRFPTDGIAIASIAGMDHCANRPECTQYCKCSVKLSSASMQDPSKEAVKYYAFFRVHPGPGEHPGRFVNGGGVTPATPHRLMLRTDILSRPPRPRMPSGECHVFGIRDKGEGPKTEPVRATVEQVDSHSIVVVLPDSGIGDIVFNGAPIVSPDQGLIGIGFLSGPLSSGKNGLIGLPIQMLGGSFKPMLLSAL